jgi:hypothetical protein
LPIAALRALEPRIAAQVRTTGVDQAQAAQIAAQALRYALNASLDPIAQWILSPHADAASEVSWAGVVAGSLRTVRVDRVFRAGPTPFRREKIAGGSSTTKPRMPTISTLRRHCPNSALLFAPQLEAYAAVLRNLHGRRTDPRRPLLSAHVDFA